MQPEAYLFDMDGLLLDTERLYVGLGVEVTTRYGVPKRMSEQFFVGLVGSSAHHANACLSEFLPAHLSVSAFLKEWDALVYARISDQAPLRPTVRATLDALTDVGARMAVVTSTRSARARHHLELARLAHYFEAVLGGDEVSANKPDPAPYLEAAARLGLPAHRCAAFEDSDRGIASAVAAGCFAVQVPDLRAANTPLPDLGQLTATTLAEGGEKVHGTAIEHALDA
ncbi:HAD family phosphatase [Aliisedimentitalea scapharcae]|uniref:HAD family phosphatase n=1 Tax=Aliisedimentitalea scapharcae TaxID=1524259 RepID=A0ABZ2XMQ3_9RHOB